MYRLTDYCTRSITEVVSLALTDGMEALFGKYDDENGFDQKRVDEFAKRSFKSINNICNKNIPISDGKQIKGNEFLKFNFQAMYLELKDKDNVYTFNEFQEGLMFALINFYSYSGYIEYIDEYIDNSDEHFDDCEYIPLKDRKSTWENKEMKDLFIKFFDDCDYFANEKYDSMLYDSETKEEKTKLKESKKHIIECFAYGLSESLSNICKLDGSSFEYDCECYSSESEELLSDNDLLNYLVSIYGMNDDIDTSPLFWDVDFEQYLFNDNDELMPENINPFIADMMSMCIGSSQDIIEMKQAMCEPAIEWFKDNKQRKY